MTTPELQQKFQTLLEEHKMKILYKVCNAHCGNRDDRDDLAGDLHSSLAVHVPPARLGQSKRPYNVL